MSVEIIATDDGNEFWSDGVGHGLGFVSHVISLQGQGSVSVADVPVRELFRLDLACPDCLPVLMLCLLLALDLFHDGQHQWRRGASGDELTVALCFVFHTVSIAEMGAEIKR